MAPSTRSLLRRFALPLGLLVAAVLYGFVGYIVVERASALDSLYMTVTTLTTVGFREVVPLGRGGQLFTISLLGIGLGAVFAAIATFTDTVISGDLAAWLRGRRSLVRMAQLNDHFIICAYGRVGRAVANELKQAGVPFVVLETDEHMSERLERDGAVYLIGDPSQEEVLERAGITRARGLVCAVDSDAVNVFITLTARQLNPGLVIVARASDRRSVARLERAGADRVVSPYDLSGRRMAALSLRPALVDFLELARGGDEMRLEEIQVRPGSLLDGMSVGEAGRRHPGVATLAVRKPDRPLVASPPGDLALEAGDLVVVLGPSDVVDHMAG